MSTDNPGTVKQAIPPSLAMSDRYRGVYEELLKLADEVGAAYAEAYRQSSAAWTETYEQLGFGVDGLQAGFVPEDLLDWPDVFASAVRSSDHRAATNDRTRIGGNLSELGRTIGLAYLDAGEKAALAAVKAYEEIGGSSPVDAVKATASTHAELARQFTQAGAGTVRHIVA